MIVRTGLLLTWLTTFAAVASGQESSSYFYVAPGEQGGTVAKTQIYEAGAGFERLLDGGVGVLVDGALLTFFDSGGSRTVGGLASIGGTFHVGHFFDWGQRVDPVVLGGYSLQFRDYTTNMRTYGAGVHYWFRDDRGLLIEWRRHQATDQSHIPHYWTGQIGLVFR